MEICIIVHHPTASVIILYYIAVSSQCLLSFPFSKAHSFINTPKHTHGLLRPCVFIPRGFPCCCYLAASLHQVVRRIVPLPYPPPCPVVRAFRWLSITSLSLRVLALQLGMGRPLKMSHGGGGSNPRVVAVQLSPPSHLSVSDVCVNCICARLALVGYSLISAL